MHVVASGPDDRSLVASQLALVEQPQVAVHGRACGYGQLVLPGDHARDRQGVPAVALAGPSCAPSLAMWEDRPDFARVLAGSFGPAGAPSRTERALGPGLSCAPTIRICTTSRDLTVRGLSPPGPSLTVLP
jgi:hypothetical protein